MAPRVLSPESGSVDRILELARRHLGMDVAWLSAFDSGSQRFEAVSSDLPSPRPSVGEELPLEGSFCVRVLDGRLTPLVSNAWADPVTRDLAATDHLRIGAYAGAPVRRRDGSVRGMLCCTSIEPRADLDPRDLSLLELLADVLAEITGDETDRAEQLAARTARVEAAIRGHGRRTVFHPMIEIATCRVMPSRRSAGSTTTTSRPRSGSRRRRRSTCAPSWNSPPPATRSPGPGTSTTSSSP